MHEHVQLFWDPEVSKCNQSRWPSNCTCFHGHRITRKESITHSSLLIQLPLSIAMYAKCKKWTFVTGFIELSFTALHSRQMLSAVQIKSSDSTSSRAKKLWVVQWLKMWDELCAGFQKTITRKFSWDVGSKSHYNLRIGALTLGLGKSQRNKHQAKEEHSLKAKMNTLSIEGGGGGNITGVVVAPPPPPHTQTHTHIHTHASSHSAEVLADAWRRSPADRSWSVSCMIVSRSSWRVSVWSVCFDRREACLPSWCNRKHDGRVSQRYRFESRRGQWALFSLIPSALSFVFLWHTYTHTHTPQFSSWASERHRQRLGESQVFFISLHPPLCQ